jgi:hypothetical protein
MILAVYLLGMGTGATLGIAGMVLVSRATR